MSSDTRLPLPRLAARARVLVKASLGWLGGYPLDLTAEGVRWRELADREKTGAIVLGARELGHASRTLAQLRGELREALPELAREPERWLAAITALLERLGAAVHHGAALPASVWSEPLVEPASRLAADRPALARLLDAASWSVVPAPWTARALLRWITTHAEPLAALLDRCRDDEACLQCLALARAAVQDDARAAGVLAAALGDPRWELLTSLPAARNHVTQLRALSLPKRWRNSAPAELPPRPPGQGRTELRAFVARWAGWDAPRRRRAARLFELALPTATVAAWQEWWQHVEREQTRLRGLLAIVDRRSVPPALSAISRRLLELASPRSQCHPPAHLDLGALLAAIERLAAPDCEPLAKTAVRTLHAVPELWRDVPARAALLLRWAELLDGPDPPRVHRLAEILDGLRQLVARAGADALAPLASLMSAAFHGENFYWYGIERQLLDAGPEMRGLDHPEAARAAREAAAMSWSAGELAFALFLVGVDVAAAKAFVGALPAKRQDLVGAPIHGIRRLIEIAGDGERAVRLRPALAGLHEDEDELAFDAARALVRAGWRALATTTFEKTPERLVDLARRRRVLAALGDTAPVEPPGMLTGAHGWIEGYPPPLAEALGALAAVDPEAEATARRLLRREVRDRPSLERELAALARREGPGIEQRRRALAARLTEPPPLAPAQVRRCCTRLRRAADRALLERWGAELNARMRAAILAQLAPAGAPDLLLDPDGLVLLDAVLGLRRWSKDAWRLGRELLRRRCGPPPWNLDDHPANLAFGERMRRAGVEVGPWLERSWRRELVGANGRVVEVALADDPLDVLRMGASFGTCLAPWDFNFSSAVVNAAEANKRVAFARCEGRVVGRCLLAIGEPLGLITFHPYCHDTTLGFEEVMARFVAELAASLGVPVRAYGEVPKLIARYWYDDGSRDLTGEIAFLAEGTPFRDALATLAPETLPAALAAACAPRAVDEPIAERLLYLPELAARPELVLPLVPLLERLRLPAGTYLSAAALALAAGAREIARSWVRRHAPVFFNSFLSWVLGDPRIDTLVELDPTLTLRLLHRTRRPEVWRWRHERDAERLLAAARAHTLLHRHRQAAELYRLAAEDPYAPEDARTHARQLAERLEHR